MITKHGIKLLKCLIKDETSFEVVVTLVVTVVDIVVVVVYVVLVFVVLFLLVLYIKGKINVKGHTTYEKNPGKNSNKIFKMAENVVNAEHLLSIPDLIAKKRDNLELSPGEIKQFIDGLSNGDVQDCHVGAMLMAIYLNGNSKVFSLFFFLIH